MTIFTARANYWQRNLEDSQKTNALSCRRTKEDGTIVPGVALFSGYRVTTILDPADALRLANELADALARPAVNE